MKMLRAFGCGMMAIAMGGLFGCIGSEEQTAEVAEAQGHAHFIKNASSASLSGAQLVVSFKETGLSSGSVETITVTANALTTYECVNGGGHNPSASNKTTTQTALSKSGTFTADKNGNVVGSETLSPPTAQDLGFSCPPGQTTTFVSITYNDVTVTDGTSGAFINLGSGFTFTNPNAP